MLKLALPLAVCIGVCAAQDAPSVPELAAHACILIVFAPEAGGASFQRQLQLIERHSFELSARNTVVVPASRAGVADDHFAFERFPVDSIEEKELRRQFHVDPADFLVILLNEHGAVQIRSANPVDIHALVATLDKPKIK